MSLPYAEKIRIQKETILGAPPPADEPLEQADFRRGITADYAKANQQGITLEIPLDWDADQETQQST